MAFPGPQPQRENAEVRLRRALYTNMAAAQRRIHYLQDAKRAVENSISFGTLLSGAGTVGALGILISYPSAFYFDPLRRDNYVCDSRATASNSGSGGGGDKAAQLRRRRDRRIRRRDKRLGRLFRLLTVTTLVGAFYTMWKVRQSAVLTYEIDSLRMNYMNDSSLLSSLQPGRYRLKRPGLE